MSFPFKYNRSYEITDIESSETISLIEDELKKKKISFQSTESQIQITLFSYLFRIPFNIVIYIENQLDEIVLHYIVNVSKLVRIIIYGIIGCIVLSVKSIELFLITAVLFSLFMYVLNLSWIVYQVEKIIKKHKKFNIPKSISEKIAVHQKEWLIDDKRCPGCGKYLSIYEIYCSGCGLKVRDYKNIPVSHTKQKETEIRYYFKKSLN
jgi:hypothetical protein